MIKSKRSAGGIATAKKLNEKQRRERGKKAAIARWKDPLIKAIHGRDDHPLVLGDIQIPCYVLEDGTRVLLQKEMARAIGMSNPNASQLSEFAKGKMIEPFLRDRNIINSLNNPIKFKTLTGQIAHGYEATILTDICDAVLEARRQNRLLRNQEKTAIKCEIIIRSLAKVGIIALIDEATGYQIERAKNDLSKILQSFIAKELQPYVKTFPSDFYKELFRLRGLDYPSGANSIKRPQYFGSITNNIIYDRLAPGVRKVLKAKIPKNAEGKPKNKLFQQLTQNTGYPLLLSLLGSVTTLMKLSNSWHDFLKKLDTIHPKFPSEDVLLLELEYRPEKDDGKGI